MAQREIRIAETLMGEEERAAAERVLRSGRLVQGPEVEAFEGELAAGLSGTAHVVALASGTAALELALVAMGVGEGDQIVTTPFTFAATANAALRAGAEVRFADIGDDMTLDPVAVADAVTDRTKAIVPVHLYGLPADVDAMRPLGIPILEDAAQAHLAVRDGRRAGQLGTAACFSFYASKNMTTGEGGAVATDDAGLAERLRVLRNQGMRGAYEYAEVGTNARMTELAAAIGRVQLHRLPGWTEQRRRIATWYVDGLAGMEGVTLPPVPAGATPSWHLFTVRLDPRLDRDTVVRMLNDDGVRARVYYPQILADVPAYRDHPRVDSSGLLDRARLAARTVLSLPIHPGVDEADVERVGLSLKRAISAGRSRP